MIRPIFPTLALLLIVLAVSVILYGMIVGKRTTDREERALCKKAVELGGLILSVTFYANLLYLATNLIKTLILQYR